MIVLESELQLILTGSSRIQKEKEFSILFIKGASERPEAADL
jgi:hypothetical protein